MRGPIANFKGHVVTALIGALFALAATLFMLSTSGGLPKLGSDYRVRALLPASGSLAAQSRVTMAGVDVGRVVSVKRQGTEALVEMVVDDDHAPIPEDSRVAIRLRTLVGEKSISIQPGPSQRNLPNGGVLPVSHADDFVEVDQILTQLRGRTRDRARQTIQGLGGAVKDKGRQLNDLLGGTAGFITDGAPVVHAVAQEHAHVTRLVSNLGQIAQRIGDRGDALQTLAKQMSVTFTALGQRDDALRATVQALPSTLTQVRHTSGVLRATTQAASPVVGRAATAVDALRPTVRSLRPAAQTGRAAVIELGRTAAPLQRVLAGLERVSSPAVAALPQVNKALCQLNPLVHYVGPYAKELTSMISGLGSAVNGYDANGHIARLYIGVNEASVIGALPPNVVAAEQKLFSSGMLQKLRLLGYNPYPAPGNANDTTVGAGSSGPQDAVNDYPRIQAAC